MGLIWRRRLGWATLSSVLLPWLAGEFAKTFYQPGIADDAQRSVILIDILVVAVIVFSLTMVFTVMWGCIVTAVMKGPKHFGDPFPGDRP
jgi:hypothetical protein